MKTPETRAEALRRAGEGWFPDEIAAGLGVSVTAVRKWCIAAGAPFRLRPKGGARGPRTPVGIRKLAAELVKGGALLREAAERLELSDTTVHHCCREFGVKPPRRGRRPGCTPPNRRAMWEVVDWDKPDYQIAGEMGVSVQRVNQKRAELCGTATR